MISLIVFLIAHHAIRRGTLPEVENMKNKGASRKVASIYIFVLYDLYVYRPVHIVHIGLFLRYSTIYFWLPASVCQIRRQSVSPCSPDRFSIAYMSPACLLVCLTAWMSTSARRRILTVSYVENTM